jgi:tRNA dimethylallyltransferase
MELARGFAVSGGAAILAMDAMQVYRGADIGTSKPTFAEREEIPHGGLDLADLGASFDVAQYLKHAEQFLREQRAAGRRVIVVGGTGLYFRALTRGLCEAPQGSDELRAELNALSTEELRERLAKIDPDMLRILDASNPRRLVRAIEVVEATGRSLRTWQEETPEPLVKEFSAFWICREKDELERRIEERVEAMFAQGWVEEVRGLMARYGSGAVMAFPGIGYREIAEMVGEPDQITKLPKGEQGEGFNGINGITELGEGKQNEEMTSCGFRPPGQQIVRGTRGEDGTVARRSMATGGGEIDRRDGARRPPESVDDGSFGGAQDGRRPPLQGVKRDILVATRQYAKRQLTWFRREPNLREVMLTGSSSLSSVLRAAVKPSLL